MTTSVQLLIMIQQRRLPVKTIQDPSHEDQDHEYKKAPNEPKNQQTW